MVDRLDKKQRSALMSRVKNKNTNIEILLRKALWQRGYRYRIHFNIAGRPDIAFPSKKIAIFCDGDFWHGRTYMRDKSNYSDFWKEKISANIKRDKKVDKVLKGSGWTVLRFWKSEILNNLDNCVDIISHNINLSTI